MRTLPPLTGPTAPEAVAAHLQRVFPQLVRIPGQLRPEALQLDEWQRITQDNPEAIGRIFWHLSQCMLLRDAAALYKGLEGFQLQYGAYDPRVAGHWMLGKYPWALGQAVLCAIWENERRTASKGEQR